MKMHLVILCLNLQNLYHVSYIQGCAILNRIWCISVFMHFYKWSVSNKAFKNIRYKKSIDMHIR